MGLCQAVSESSGAGVRLSQRSWGWCQAVSERSQAGVRLSPCGKSQGLMPGVAIYGKVLHHCTSESLTLSNTPIPNVTGCYSTEVLMRKSVANIWVSVFGSVTTDTPFELGIRSASREFLDMFNRYYLEITGNY